MKRFLTMMTMASVSMMMMAQSDLGSGLNQADFNKNVRPGDDFYEYACGGWMKNNPLPGAYSRYGSFDRLQEENDKRINGILKELQSNTYKKGTIEQKLSDLYKLAMDSTRRNKEGVAPLMPLIKKLEAAKTNKQLLDIQLSQAPYGEQEFFFGYFGADEKNAGQNILSLYQGGLTLGQKEYYLENDKATAEIREAFKKHVVKMFQLFGFSKSAATKKMQNIMKVETALAKVSKSQTELRDVEANYNKMTLKEFESRYPNLPLVKVMNAKGIDTKYLQEMVVGQPEFLDGANKLVGSIKPAELRVRPIILTIRLQPRTSTSMVRRRLVVRRTTHCGSVAQVRLSV